MDVIETLRQRLLDQSFASIDKEEKIPGERQGSKEGVAPPSQGEKVRKGVKKHCFTVTHLNPCNEVELKDQYSQSS